jgi:hypothetical protein
MKTSELKVRLDNLMRETGQGHKDIYFLSDDGDVFDLSNVVYDEDAHCFFLLGGTNDEQG